MDSHVNTKLSKISSFCLHGMVNYLTGDCYSTQFCSLAEDHLTPCYHRCPIQHTTLNSTLLPAVNTSTTTSIAPAAISHFLPCPVPKSQCMLYSSQRQGFGTIIIMNTPQTIPQFFHYYQCTTTHKMEVVIVVIVVCVDLTPNAPHLLPHVVTPLVMMTITTTILILLVI